MFWRAQTVEEELTRNSGGSTVLITTTVGFGQRDDRRISPGNVGCKQLTKSVFIERARRLGDCCKVGFRLTGL